MRRLLVVCLAFVLGLALVELGLRAFGQRWLREHGRDPRIGVAAGGVLCVGDSVTFGSYVSAEEAWPARLGSLLERAGDPRPVLNVGIPGTSADRVARGLQEQLARYRPAIVVVLCGHNNAWLDAGPLPRAGFFAELRLVKLAKLLLASRQEALAEIEEQGEPLEVGDYLETEEPIDMLRFRRSAEDVAGGRIYRVHNRAGERVELFQPELQLAKEELHAAIRIRLAEVTRICREQGVELLLLTYPPTAPGLSETNRCLRRAAAQAGAELLDLEAELGPLLAEVRIEDFRFADGHPRAPVHELVAQRVYAALRARAWIEGPELEPPSIATLFPPVASIPRGLRREGGTLVVEGLVGDGVRLLFHERAAEPPITPELLRLPPPRLRAETGWREIGLHALGREGRLELPIDTLLAALDARGSCFALALFVPQTRRDGLIARSELVEIGLGER